MSKNTYKYNGKEYERIPSGPKCLGCDFLDEETAECLSPNEMYICMELDEKGDVNHFQFKEIKL